MSVVVTPRDHPAARVQTKGEATREAIKQAARGAIARDGFLSVTIADIMSLADRSAGAFYKHFESKEALLYELMGEFKVQLKQEVSRPLAEGEGLQDHLMSRLESFWRIYREHWPVALAAFQMSMIDNGFARAWHDIRQQGIRGLTVVMGLAAREGRDVGPDPLLAASALCSMLEYTCYNWTARSGDFPDRIIDDETALRVLRPMFLRAFGFAASDGA